MKITNRSGIYGVLKLTIPSVALVLLIAENIITRKYGIEFLIDSNTIMIFMITGVAIVNGIELRKVNKNLALILIGGSILILLMRFILFLYI